MTAILYDVPGPRARRRNGLIGAGATTAMAAVAVWVVYRFYVTGQLEPLKWEQFLYASVQREIVGGVLSTLKAASMSAVLALSLGLALAAGRRSDHALLRAPSVVLVELFRAVPLLILMFFVYYGPKSFGVQLDPIWAVVVGLTLYNGAVLAEILRAGLGAVPRGQAEAALALGLRKGQVLRLILLPQAVRAMAPSIVSQLVVLLKDTALGFIVTYPELLHVGKQIGGRLAYDLPFVPAYVVVAAIYISLCSILSVLAHRLDRRASADARAAKARRAAAGAG